MSDGKLLHTLQADRDSFRSLVWSPNGRFIAGVLEGNTVRVWQLKDGKLLHSLADPEHDIAWARFSPDSRTLAVSSFGGTVALWDLDTGARLGTLRDGGPGFATFLPDGKLLVAKATDGGMQLWDVDEPRLLLTLRVVPGVDATNRLGISAGSAWSASATASRCSVAASSGPAAERSPIRPRGDR